MRKDIDKDASPLAADQLRMNEPSVSELLREHNTGCCDGCCPEFRSSSLRPNREPAKGQTRRLIIGSNDPTPLARGKNFDAARATR